MEKKRHAIRISSPLVRIAVSFFMSFVLFVSFPSLAQAASGSYASSPDSLAFVRVGTIASYYIPAGDAVSNYYQYLVDTVYPYTPSASYPETLTRDSSPVSVYLWTHKETGQYFYALGKALSSPVVMPFIFDPDNFTAVVNAVNNYTASQLSQQTLALESYMDVKAQAIVDAVNLDTKAMLVAMDSYPSSTGMSYSTKVPGVSVESFNMKLNKAVSLSGSSYAVAVVSCYVKLSGTLPVGSYFIPFFTGTVPTDISGTLPNSFSDPSKYSLFDVNVINSSRGGVMQAVDLSNYPYSTSLYYDSYFKTQTIRFSMYFYVFEDVPAFDYTITFKETFPAVYQADSNLILDELQQGNLDANSNSQKEINAANSNSQNEINAANNNSQKEIDTANKNADDIMHSYDSSSQQDDNSRFESSRAELQETEDSLFDSAATSFGALDMTEYGLGKFSAMQGAFSFVSGFLQSLYVKMGAFGTVVTVGLVLLIATKVIGLFRFQVVDHS